MPKSNDMVAFVDIDGTIANTPRLDDPDAFEALSKSRKNEVVAGIEPLPGMVGFVRLLKDAGVEVAFLTGRPESVRECTLAWLNTHVYEVEPRQLFMRPEIVAGTYSGIILYKLDVVAKYMAHRRNVHTVLVADDDEGNRNTVRRVLEASHQ